MIDDHWSAIRRLYAGHPGAVYSFGPELSWVLTDLPSPMFNSVFGARLAEDDADEIIRTTIERFRRAGVPMTWRVGPTSTPADLGRRLKKTGLIEIEPLFGMAADLADLPSPRPTPGLTIEPVDDPAELEEWLAVVAEGFRMTKGSAQALARLFAGRMSEPRSRVLYLAGYLRGRLAAAASVRFLPGSAGLGYVATRPEYRRRGLATALSLAALAEARRRGLETAVLHASKMGEPVYRRLGFRRLCLMPGFRLEPGAP